MSKCHSKEMQSKNMNYIFNVQYFEGIDWTKNITVDGGCDVEELIKKRNKQIVEFSFADAEMLKECESMEGYQKFELYTLYPGLLIGVGNPHEIAVAGALKQGFSFDYVTGVPYVPGSSLKGMLRSYFPDERRDKDLNSEYEFMIKGILGKPNVDVYALRDCMFEKEDVYFGAFPVMEKGKKQALMEMEFITSHKEVFKNPNPVSLIKVKPSVKFAFSFLFSKNEINGVEISVEDKVNLCKKLILLMGIGAKTNTGFGKFSEQKPVENIAVHTIPVVNEGTQNTSRINNDNCINEVHKCQTPGCKNDVRMNPKTQKYYKFCWQCNQKRNPK